MRFRPLLAAIAMTGAISGCSCNPDLVLGDRDMVFIIPPGSDLAGYDLTGANLSPCGNMDPECKAKHFGPPNNPFSLQSDPQPDPNESDQGVDRDKDGYLVLSNSHANFDFLWLANTDDWGMGSVAKLDSKSVREVARYFSVTCYSNPGGGRAACDGTNGCCSRDDYQGYQNRANNMPSGYAVVNLTTNYPSRTAVDFNGDVWVANRAFGVQSSVTKIANNRDDCSERNGTPGIQTSSDVNSDGVIDTDCNRNGVPDDVADVMSAPCVNGKAQEFYGLDDECILFTTNTNSPNMWGRPLALGQGAIDFGPSDAWAGTYNDGKFFRIDGQTGMTKAQTQVPVPPGSGPYGAAVDGSGIAWVTFLSAGLAWFDTVQPQQTGAVRGSSATPISGYGITLDRDQNVWTGGLGDGNAHRYTPDRSNGNANLGNGFWTTVLGVGDSGGATGNGRGIAADSRTMGSYFVWMARDGGFVVRIPASTIPVPKGSDMDVNGNAMAAMQVAGGNTIGAGVDVDQNIWGVSNSGSVATRIKVDVAGNMTAPDIGGGADNQGCPIGAGDRCTLGLAGTGSTPDPYTYSDFTGFGLRNFTNPKGHYSYIQKGCDGSDTNWFKIEWGADVPPLTTLTVRARSGKNPIPDNTWGPWTGNYSMSPAQLDAMPPLAPNPANYLQVEFDLATSDKAATPRLKYFDIIYVCGNVPG